MAFEDITIERYTVHGVRVGVSVSGKGGTKVMRLSVGADVIEALGLNDDVRLRPQIGTMNDLGLLKLSKCSNGGRRVFMRRPTTGTGGGRAEVTFSAKKWRIRESHETDQCSKWEVVDDGSSLLVTLPAWCWSHLDKNGKKGGQ